MNGSISPAPGGPLPPLRGALGIVRSVGIYYRPGRARRLDRMHARFAGQGDLVFDIGSHVGDRVASFRRLGARVVAVEPQPGPARLLRFLYGRSPEVSVVQAAIGSSEGRAELHLNLRNPTVSSASTAFIRAADGAPGWEGQHWEQRIEVAQTTLEALIARFGSPVFTKIDVEGFEAEVLRGLDQPLRALSFEVTTIQRDIAHAALAELHRLGPYRFNAALGESQRLLHPRWLDARAIGAWLDALPHEANSGDIYAVLAR